MILYAIADKLNRMFGHNCSISRTKSSPRRWWNQIVQWDWGRPTYVGGYYDDGTAILMDAQAFYESGITVMATQEYINQANGKKDLQAAVNQGLLSYLLITTGIINIPIRFLVITIDLFICQPIVFLLDILILLGIVCPARPQDRLDKDVLWSKVVEERRSREWEHIKNKSFSEITKNPAWIRW